METINKRQLVESAGRVWVQATGDWSAVLEYDRTKENLFYIDQHAGYIPIHDGMELSLGEGIHGPFQKYKVELSD